MKALFSTLMLVPFLFLHSCSGQTETAQKAEEPKEAFAQGEQILMGPPNINEYVYRYGRGYILKREASPQIGEYVRRIFQDQKGNFWFGTNGYGVCRYDGNSFRYFSVAEGLAGTQVTGILEDREGNLWFSTNGGVSRFDPSKEQSGSKAFTTFTTQQGLSDNWVWSLFQDSRGTIWAGTNEGLCQLNGGKFAPFDLPQAEVKNPKPRFSTKLVRCIMEDKNGNLWFGTDGVGVCIYDPSAGQPAFRHITVKDGLCGNQIVCIIQDKSGNIWLSSMFGGVSRYNGKTFRNYNLENNSMGDNEVWTLYEDRAGDVWFCAEGFGVYRIRGESIKNFSKEEGLPIQAVQSIFQDGEGRMWIGGYGGLYRYDGKTFVNITKGDAC